MVFQAKKQGKTVDNITMLARGFRERPHACNAFVQG